MTCRWWNHILDLISSFSPDVDGDQQHFPVFIPDEDRVAQIEADYVEASKDPTKHYDASRENRTAGAGFYQFSADEETRARQMEELKKAREETEQGRRDAATEEGVQGNGKDAEPVSKITGRGMDKRKRELEERRKALDAKRRKTALVEDVPTPKGASPQTPLPSSKTSSNPSLPPHSPVLPNLDSRSALREETSAAPNSADDFLARLEADLTK